MTALTCTAQEAADRIGVSYDHLIRGCRAGTYPHHKFGRLVKFTDADIEAILSATAASIAETNTTGLSARSAARLARVS